MGTAFLRAHALLSPTSDHRQLATCLQGLVGYYLTTANFAATTRYASELEALGQRESSSAYQCGALMALGSIDYFCADLDQARRHLERCVAIHDPAQSATAVELFDLETGITGSNYLAWTLWAQGYPDDAKTHADHAIAAARQCGHPLTRAQEASLASGLAYMRRDTPTMLELAQEATAISKAHAISLFEGIGQLMSAWCRRGDKEALDAARAGVELVAGTGTQNAVPQILSLLAEVAAAAGELDEATAIIDMALDISAGNGMVVWDAELHRLKGELYLSTADRTDDDAEAEFQQALTIARTQHARSLELRAATSLARLWTAHNRHDEARDLLAPVYDWFTQGLDTPDLLDARALLDDLT